MSNKLSYAFKDHIQCGLGADLIRLTGLLNRCEISGQTLYLPADDIWDHTPISPTYIDKSQRNENENDPITIVEEGSINNRGWGYYFEETIPTDTENSYPRIKLSNIDTIMVPNNKEHMTKFQYRSELLKSIYKPKQCFYKIVQTHIQNHLSELLGTDYAMIHIRRGDKVAGPWHETQAISVDKYLDALKEWYSQNLFSTEKTGDKIVENKQEEIKKENIDLSNKFNVFIMTDCDAVITEIQDKSLEYLAMGIRFIWDKTEIRRDGYCYKLHRYGYTDAEKVNEMITNMKNLWLMEYAKILIGTRSSFLFIVGELLNGKPNISLENNTMYPTDLYE